MNDEQQSDETPIQLPIAPGAIRTVALAELERADTFVRALDLRDWAKPSAAAGWTIGDVVAHLGLTVGLYGRVIDAATAGWTAGGLWKAMGQIGQRLAPAASPALNAVNKAIPRLIDRTLAPEVIKGQFGANVRTLKGKIERISSADYMRPVHYMGAPWPLSFLLAALVDELGLHRWDIASRLDPGAALSEEARSVIPWFFWSGTPFMLRLPKGTNGTVQVVLSDPQAEMWWELRQVEAAQGSGRAARTDVTIGGSTGMYALVISGRVPLEDALHTTSIRFDGDEALARVFLGSWRIV